MTIGRVLQLSIGALMAATVVADAQSLGELARQEEARRATERTSKVYTNSDLKPDPSATAAGSENAAPAGMYFSISEDRYVTSEEMVTLSRRKVAHDDQMQYEPPFRRAASQLRSRIMNARKEVDALQGTAGDESRSAAERTIASRLLEQRRTILADLEKQWVKLEQNVEAAGMPRSWIEPAPPLSASTGQQR